MAKTSYINGKALVVFGGSINFGIGYNPNDKVVGLNMSELTNQVQVGEKLNGNEEKNEPQVTLIFGCVESINVFRSVLDIAERTLKDGAIPQIGGEK
jgi:hypothetical protein